MLEKAKRIDDVTIFRRGCGHFLILLRALKDYGELDEINKYLLGMSNSLPVVCQEVIIMALRKFTDIKNPKKYARKHTIKAVTALVEIIKYNSVPEKQGDTGKDNGIDELSVDILEIIARGGYASNPDYVFDKIDLPTVMQLKKRLDLRERNHYLMSLMIHHDPKGAQEQLNKTANVQYLTWGELARRKKRHG